MALRIFALLVALALHASVSEAGTYVVRGRITDAEGKGVADVTVATAWTVTPKGARAHRGARTDAEGRFAIRREFVGHPIVLLALDASAKRGAVLTIDAAGLGKERVAALEPCVTVRGTMSTEGGKYYPGTGLAWVALRDPRTYLLRVEQDKGAYAFQLPPGDYQLLVGGFGYKTERLALPLRARKDALKLESIDLEDEKELRATPGAKAPPIAFVEATRGVQEAIADHHLPRRWTLCYFWAHR